MKNVGFNLISQMVGPIIFWPRSSFSFDHLNLHQLILQSLKSAM